MTILLKKSSMLVISLISKLQKATLKSVVDSQMYEFVTVHSVLATMRRIVASWQRQPWC